jgi:hypothetical protein
MSDIIQTDATKKINLANSGIETIDTAFFNYIDTLNIFCNTNDGWNKIPIIWSSAERSFQIKNNKKLRDKNGSLIPPIISIERSSITKDPTKKTAFQANLSPQQDYYYITKLLNQDKTSNFANADAKKQSGQVNFVTSKKNRKQVYQHIAVRIPVYVVVEYKINILTNYQTQMNEAIQPFMARTAQNYFIIKGDDYRFECMMDPSFAQENNSSLDESERTFKTTITVKVIGYLVGEGENEQREKTKITENAVEVKIQRESILSEDASIAKRKKAIERLSAERAEKTKNENKESVKKNSGGVDINKKSSGGSVKDDSEKTKKLNFSASNIETIDGALYDYLEQLNIFCNTNNGWNKVPVIWSSAERSFQIKNNKELRDKNGSLIAPIISIERDKVTKDPNKKGSYQSNVSPKQDRVYITKLLNQDKTSNFANADALRKSGQLNFITSKRNEKIVYQHYAMRIPIYINIEYKINILTNYQLQMNEILQPFMAHTAQSYFTISKDGHTYEGFYSPEFNQELISDLGEEERKYKTTISVRVLGYLLSEGDNREDRNINISENAVEIKLPKEKIIIDGPEPKKKKQKEIAGGYGTETTAATTSGTIKKTFIIGNGIDTIYTINHGMNTRDAYVSVRENTAPFYQVIAHVEFPSLNTIEVDVGDIIDENSHVVTIIG